MSTVSYRRKWWELWLPICFHADLRPASIRGNPAEYCDDCEREWMLTNAQFYARFGVSFEALTGKVQEMIRGASPVAGTGEKEAERE